MFVTRSCSLIVPLKNHVVVSVLVSLSLARVSVVCPGQTTCLPGEREKEEIRWLVDAKPFMLYKYRQEDLG